MSPTLSFLSELELLKRTTIRPDKTSWLAARMAHRKWQMRSANNEEAFPHLTVRTRFKFEEPPQRLVSQQPVLSSLTNTQETKGR